VTLSGFAASHWVLVESITKVVLSKAADLAAALAMLGQVLANNPLSLDGGIHQGNHGALDRTQRANGDSSFR